MKQQVIFLNGAVPKENFDSYSAFLESREYDPYKKKFLNWNKTLGERLGKDCEFLRAAYDGIDFADYEAWKIMFEKMIPYMRDDCIFVTTSLGSTFILKYMIETGFPNKQGLSISKMFFLAAALRSNNQEKLGSFAFDIGKISEIGKIAKHIYIYHSSDDNLVPMSDSEELFTYFPDAIFRKFTDKGHFYEQAFITELEQDIKA